MQSLARALTKARQGQPLPDIFPALRARGIRIYGAETTMIAGQPNAGKSFIALFAGLFWAKAGEWVLYFSADSNEATQTTRTAANLTGHPVRDVREALAHGGEPYYEEILTEGVPQSFMFDFNSNPSLDDIELTLRAYDELFGRYPSVVVVDNLMNVEDSGDENAKRGLIEIQKALKYWSREHGVGWLLLHHMSEAVGDPVKPMPRKALQQKVSEIPESILSVAYNPDSKEFGVAAVKNRHDVADPKAANPVMLIADLDRCRFYDNRFQAITAGMVL